MVYQDPAQAMNPSVKIGKQLIGIAYRVTPERETSPPARLIQHPGRQEGLVVQQQPLLIDRAAEGRHRAWTDAPHIGMVPATGHKAPWSRFIPWCEDRRDGGDVR